METVNRELSDLLTPEEEAIWGQIRADLKKRAVSLKNDVWSFFSELKVVRDKRLYRIDFATFEEYVDSELCISLRHANRMMSAAETLDSVSAFAADIPEVKSITTEFQARALAGVSKEELPDVLKEAAASSEDGVLSASVLKGARKRTKAPIVPPAQNEETASLQVSIDDAIAASKAIRLAIQSAIKMVGEVNETPGAQCLFDWARNIIDNLETAKGAVLNATPYEICRRCNGSRCPACGNFGWVTERVSRSMDKADGKK